MSSLKESIDQLPPNLRKEVADFVEYLLFKKAKEESEGKGKLKQDWAGALNAYKKQYSSVQLQEKAKEWRTE